MQERCCRTESREEVAIDRKESLGYRAGVLLLLRINFETPMHAIGMNLRATSHTAHAGFEILFLFNFLLTRLLH
jgi:hypothetical protein